LDFDKGFTISGWVEFTPKNERGSIGDILLIKSPSFSSPIFSIWVEFPEKTIHFSYLQSGSDIVKILKTGVKVPEGVFQFAIAYNSTAFILYINGEKCKEIPETNSLPNPDEVRTQASHWYLL
jgi:hypothetical protein